MKLKILIVTMIMSVFVITSSVTSYAAEETYNFGGYDLPKFPLDEFEYGYSLVVTYENLGVPTCRMWVSDAPLYYKASDNTIRLADTDTDNYIQTYYTNFYEDTGWSAWRSAGGYSGVVKDGVALQSVNVDRLVWTWNDILKEDGTMYKNGDPNFFPLARLIMGRAKEAMETETVPTITQTVKTIVGSAVLCLALLISLLLFGKVFRKFRIL